MGKITTENQLYARLARRGDPSAFYALFHGQLCGFYTTLRTRGKDHQAACGDTARAAAAMYGKFIKRRAGDPQKWFAAKCGLKKLKPGSATVNVTIADIADCEKRFAAAVNKSYSERLDRGSDGKGNLRGERTLLPLAAGSIAAACLIAFLFFSQSVLSVSFGRFGEEYRLSFPQIAESLWNLSGLVHAPAVPEPAAGAARPAGNISAEPTGGHE